MNEKNILKEVINSLYGKNPKQDVRYVSGKAGKGFCLQTNRVYIFPEDVPIILADNREPMNLDKLTPDIDTYHRVTSITYLDYCPLGQKKKYTLAKLEAGNKTAFMNKDYMKHFDNPTYFIKGRKDIIQVYEEGILVALVLPVNYKEGE